MNKIITIKDQNQIDTIMNLHLDFILEDIGKEYIIYSLNGIQRYIYLSELENRGNIIYLKDISKETNIKLKQVLSKIFKKKISKIEHFQSIQPWKLQIVPIILESYQKVSIKKRKYQYLIKWNETKKKNLPKISPILIIILIILCCTIFLLLASALVIN